MPTAVAKGDGGGYRKGPPKLMIKINGINRLNACAHAIIKQIKKAHICGVSIAVKAYCDCKDTAEYWAGIWHQFGFKPELLLQSTVYFEAQPRQLKETVLKLPPASTRFVFSEKIPPKKK